MRSTARSPGRCLFQVVEVRPPRGNRLSLVTLSTRRRSGLSRRKKARLGLNLCSRKSPPLRGLHFYVSHMGIPHKVFLEQLSLNFIKKFKNALERSAHLSPMFLSSDSPRMTLGASVWMLPEELVTLGPDHSSCQPRCDGA